MGEAERVASGIEEMCPTILTRQVIERASARPANEGVSITSKCHRNAGVKVWYFASTGCALLVCAACNAPAVMIQVANEEPQ
jgi:hypothetical protein